MPKPAAQVLPVLRDDLQDVQPVGFALHEPLHASVGEGERGGKGEREEGRRTPIATDAPPIMAIKIATSALGQCQRPPPQPPPQLLVRHGSPLAFGEASCADAVRTRRCLIK